MGQEAKEVREETPADPQGTTVSAHGASCEENLTVPGGSQSPSEGGQHGCHGGSGLELVRLKESSSLNPPDDGCGVGGGRYGPCQQFPSNWGQCECGRQERDAKD